MRTKCDQHNFALKRRIFQFEEKEGERESARARAWNTFNNNNQLFLLAPTHYTAVSQHKWRNVCCWSPTFSSTSTSVSLTRIIKTNRRNSFKSPPVHRRHPSCVVRVLPPSLFITVILYLNFYCFDKNRKNKKKCQKERTTSGHASFIWFSLSELIPTYLRLVSVGPQHFIHYGKSFVNYLR